MNIKHQNNRFLLRLWTTNNLNVGGLSCYKWKVDKLDGCRSGIMFEELMSLVMDFYMACLDFGSIQLTGFKLVFNLVSTASIH